MKPTTCVRLTLISFAAAMLAGCGVQTRPVGALASLNGIGGQVHGGQQPVSGATIQLYTVGTTGDGSAATPMLTTTVKTNATGGFDFTGDYSCSGATQVYLVATGGNPGLGANNPNLALMTALGPCSGLTPTTFISVNELTTVAAVAALYPYMNSITAIGSGSGDATALSTAFTLASEFVDPTSGAAPGNNIPSGMSVPVTEINTLADMVAACVNSAGGHSGDNTNCGTLFSLTTPSGGTTPTDTIFALLNLEKNPMLNTTPLTYFPPAASPYQPTLVTPPANYTVALAAANLITATPSVTFGDTPVGAPALPQIATLVNTTGATIPVTGVGLAGANTGDFQIGNICPASLATGASCAVAVSFIPLAPGTRSATLLINTNGTVAATILSGNGVAASTGPVTLSPASLNFVVANIPQTVTLSNLGSATLGISAINISSPNFTQLNDCEASLSGQSVCHIYVSTTSAAGSYTGTLSVVDTDTTDAQTVQLTSTDIPGYSGTTSFGVVVGGAQNVSITGNGVASTLSSIQGGTFTTSCSPSCGTYFFDPTQAGESYALATQTNMSQVTNTLISGYEAQSTRGFRIESYPATSGDQPVASHFYGPVTRNTVSTDTFTVQNLSTLPLTFNAPVFTTVGGNLAGEFTASGCTSLNGVVVASLNESGSNCDLVVTFTPQMIGTRQATLTLTDTTGVSQTLELQGYGQYPAPGSPASTVFGSVTIGTSLTQNISVVVPYSHPMLASISATGSQAFTLASSGYCSGATSPCVFQVTFTPTTTNPVTGYLLVTDPVSGLTSSTTLTGTGTM